MFDSIFPNLKVADEPVYKSELSPNGSTFIKSLQLFSPVSQVSVENTIAETSIIGAINGSVTIPADTLESGDLIFIETWGSIRKQIPANKTIFFRIAFGGYNANTITILQNPLTSNFGFRYRIVTCYRMNEFLGNPAPFLQYHQYLSGSQTFSNLYVQPDGLLVNPIIYNNSIDNDITVTAQLSEANLDFEVTGNVRAMLVKK
jgi:hypothetical protein